MAEKEADKNQLVFGESDNKLIRDILLERNMISSDQLMIALQEQKKDLNHKNLDTILIDLGFITEKSLKEVLAEYSGTKIFDLKNAIIDPNLVPGFSKEIAQKYQAIPLFIQGNELNIAIVDIYNIISIDAIKTHLPKNLIAKFLPAGEFEISEAIDKYFGYEMSIEGILKEIETGGNSEPEENSKANYTNPTVRLVDAFLADAIKKNASDIHLEPDKSFLRIRYRIDGVLRQIRSFHKNYWQAIVVRIKILSGMNITENRIPQDGRIDYNLMGRVIDFRVATQPTIHGENIVLRILDKKQNLVQIEKLGFSQYNTNLIKRLLMRPEGIIIVTGPTGSGKTTTLYSILNYINTIEKNIMTLEDPIEYELPLIRQSNIKELIGWNFGEAIRSLMRQDLDVIFIGEIRDSETASIALRASMTGHQVFSTLHTNDAIGAIPRLLDIGVSNQLLSGTLICIIAQRLARVLCDKCKVKKKASYEESVLLGLDPAKETYIYEAGKCEKCENIGYKGRISINEILAIDRELDELISTNATRKTILEYAKKQNFQTMLEDGTEKVLQGIIDIQELVKTIDTTDRL